MKFGTDFFDDMTDGRQTIQDWDSLTGRLSLFEVQSLWAYVIDNKPYQTLDLTFHGSVIRRLYEYVTFCIVIDDELREAVVGQIKIIHDHVHRLFEDQTEALETFDGAVTATRRLYEKYGHEGIREMFHGKDGFIYVGEALIDTGKSRD